MIRPLAAFCAALALLSAAALSAQERAAPVVLELFTSQGCSSCPPADALLEELSARDGVIALAWHVDYWDYLGWTDPFADAAHTQRQRAYGAALGARALFTPQLVINGTESMIGSRRAAAGAALARALERPESVALRVRRAGDRLEIAAQVRETGVEAQVLLAAIAPPSPVAIARGENAGRHETVRRAARLLGALGALEDGRGAWWVPIPQNAVEIVALAQAHPGGPILGAARLRLDGASKMAGAAPEVERR